MQKEESVLYAGQLLEKVYDRLKEELPCEEIIFPERMLVEIANDSDGHRHKIGYMGYDSVLFIKTEEKGLVIGCGKACGSYPADPYSRDILLLKVPLIEESPEQLSEIKRCMEISDYFKNSIIVAMANGYFGIQKENELPLPDLSEFVVQEAEINPDVIHLDLRPVYKKSMGYKQELVDVIIDAIKKMILS